MRAYERFLNYVRIHTASAENSDLTPSTPCQLDLSRFLAAEMKELGLKDVYMDENAYVYGALPATPGCERAPAIGLIAHLDTVPDFPGENVKPQLIENYDGGDVTLGGSGRVLSPRQFPDLKELTGHSLICTDGSTVLGADDKAGIAEIMTAAERLINDALPHGRVALCFTPDEEIGHGAALLDLQRLGADIAYTVDGGPVEEINFETFNAASAHWDIEGFNVHPGSAKDTMVNASLVAMEINSMLPAGQIPGKTQDYEGFFHLTDMKGSVEKAELDYIIRDHDEGFFSFRKESMRHIEKLINEKYGPGTARLSIKEQYKNMALPMGARMEVVELAERAIVKTGRKPLRRPIRGGTDGAQLSFRGLLCPNLGTGGAGFHGPYEHISAQNMDAVVDVLMNIIGGCLEGR